MDVAIAESDGEFLLRRYTVQQGKLHQLANEYRISADRLIMPAKMPDLFFSLRDGHLQVQVVGGEVLASVDLGNAGMHRASLAEGDGAGVILVGLRERSGQQWTVQAFNFEFEQRALSKLWSKEYDNPLAFKGGVCLVGELLIFNDGQLDFWGGYRYLRLVSRQSSGAYSDSRLQSPDESPGLFGITVQKLPWSEHFVWIADPQFAIGDYNIRSRVATADPLVEGAGHVIDLRALNSR